ncbi:MAG TPA: glycosyl hydrolase, partial [Rhodothermales bacterium]|nr:glycosyl hydrolase [Rhodothermales bacterium]
MSDEPGGLTRRHFLQQTTAFAAAFTLVPPGLRAWAEDAGLPHVRTLDDLERGFTAPPASTRPWVYWYWLSDNVSRQGITRDLEAMARVGIGEALIGSIFLDDEPGGNVKALTEPWWELLVHAVREGRRVGVDIGLYNSPGWSQSGGPWVTPEQSMRYLVSTERRLTGPQRFEGTLPAPADPFQDVALLAFPAPARDADTLDRHAPRVTTAPAAPDVAHLFDGDRTAAFVLPPDTARQPFTVDVEVAAPFVARSLTLHPAPVPLAVNVEVLAEDDTGALRPVRSFRLDRSNPMLAVGPMVYGPLTVAFPAVTTRRFRFVFTGLEGREGAGLTEIELSGAARLEQVVEKQLGKMHPTPHPLWDAYLWPPSAEPEQPDLAVQPEAVVDLRGHLGAGGVLRWDVPPGEWIVLRTGMTPTKVTNAPASPEATGLEVDKMNRQALEAHFDAYVGQLLRRLTPDERTAFRHVVADSYETGSQNWTEGFEEAFRARYGYDPVRWLPVLTGRLLGSAGQSDRFLWDLRRLVADRVSTEYVGALRELSHRHG